MPTIRQYRIYCNTEQTFINTRDKRVPTICPNNKNHSIDESLTTILKTESDISSYNVGDRLRTIVGEETLFGDIKTATYDPIFQNYTLYGLINDQVYRYSSSGGATVQITDAGNEINLSLGVSSGAIANFGAKQVIKYRPGYSNVTRFNSVFSSGITGCEQSIGLVNKEAELFFKMNGPEFGIEWGTDGLAHCVRLTINTAETQAGNATVRLNGTNYTVPLTNVNNTAFTAYEIAKFSYSGWITENIGNIVIFQATTVGLRTSGTYTYTGVNASTGTFTTLKSGADMTTTFIPRKFWNGDSELVTTLDPLKRNMYSIEYSWYGSGNINFKVYNGTISRMENLHTLKFANLQTVPSLSQPNLFLEANIRSTTSTTPKTIKVAGNFAATEGVVKIIQPVYGISNTKSISANTETNILCIKNRDTVNGFSNNSETLITRLSLSVDGNKSVTFKVIKIPTTISAGTSTNYLNWQYVNESNSITLYDTNSNTYTGGIVLDSFTLSKTGNLFLDLAGREYVLYQNERIVFSAFSTNISEVSLTLSIIEDL